MTIEDRDRGKQHPLFVPPFPTCLQIVETIYMHHPDPVRLSYWLIWVSSTGLASWKTVLNMLATSENFKIYLDFSDCFKEYSLFKVHFNLTCSYSFSHAKLQPHKPSRHPLRILSVSASPNLCSNLILALSIFPSPSSLIQILCLFQLQRNWHLPVQMCVGLPSFKAYLLSICCVYIFSTPPYFLCSHRRFGYTSLDHKHIPSIISNSIVSCMLWNSTNITVYCLRSSFFTLCCLWNMDHYFSVNDILQSQWLRNKGEPVVLAYACENSIKAGHVSVTSIELCALLSL